MTKNDFVNAIRAARERMTDEQIAELLRISLPTIQRWSMGDNLPAQSLRAKIVSSLVNATEG